MSWNYRIVRYLAADAGYGLHEVFYEPVSGVPFTMTERPVGFTAWPDEGPEGVIASLEMALADARKLPVLEEPETWPVKEGTQNDPS